MKENKLNKMKENYEEIQIPENLEANMKKTIERAKSDKKKETKNKRNVLIFKRTGLTAAAAMLTITILTNTNSTIAFALEKVPVLGAITKVVTFRNYTDEKKNYVADVKIPQIDETKQKSEDKVNTKVKNDMDRLIAQYKSDVKEDIGHESVETSYKTITDNDKLFTLRIDTVISQGSSDSTSLFYHIDKKNDQIIELNNLFAKDSDYVKILSEEVKSQMRERTKKDDSQLFFLDDKEMPENNFKAIKENQNFYVNNAGNLVLSFDKYEVAPGYMGQVEFEIDSAKIQSILDADSILK